MNKSEITGNLKILLGNVGFTQTWAAKKLGVSAVYLNRVLSGEKTPSDDLASKMIELSATLKSSGLVKVV